MPKNKTRGPFGFLEVIFPVGTMRVILLVLVLITSTDIFYQSYEKNYQYNAELPGPIDLNKVLMESFNESMLALLAFTLPFLVYLFITRRLRSKMSFKEEKLSLELQLKKKELIEQIREMDQRDEE
jgi:hypothetical protein